MRKHFLILMLFALLPLSGWAVSFLDETVTASANDAPYNTAPGTVYVDQQNPGSGIKGGITVFINNVQTFDWDWDGKFYRTSDDAAAENASGLVTPATGFNTPSVGTYYIRIVPTTQANSDYKVIALIIKKADIANADFNAPLGETTLAFQSKTTELALIKTKGTWKGVSSQPVVLGTFMYSLDNTTWETDFTKIKAINAGDHKVYYKIIGDANHNDRLYVDPAASPLVPLSITVNIAAKELPILATEGAYTFTAPTTAPIYNGAELTAAKLPTFAAVDEEDNLIAGTDYDITWHKGGIGEDASTPLGAGTYYMKITGKGNYKTTSVRNDETNWKFSVARKPISVYVEDEHMTYNGAAIPTVDAVDPVYSAVPNETTLTAGNTYYESAAGAGQRRHRRHAAPDL